MFPRSLSTFKVVFRHKLQIEKLIVVQNNKLVEYGRKRGVLSSTVLSN